MFLSFVFCLLTPTDPTIERILPPQMGPVVLPSGRILSGPSGAEHYASNLPYYRTKMFMAEQLIVRAMKGDAQDTVAAGPVVSLPKTLAGAAGDLIQVKAESGAELVTWDSSEGLTITLPKTSDPAMKSVYIHAKENGTYGLTASIPNGKECRVAICLVTIGPRPPPPPPPQTTFQEKLQTAFQADAATKDQFALLAALYRKAATSTVLDPGLATTKDLLGEMQRAVKLLGLAPGSLQKTARVVADFLNLSFSSNQPLDAELRKKIAAAFTEVAAGLEGTH